MLRPFELHTPDSLVRASSLLQERGDDATVYAGGTELLLVMKAGFVQYQDLVDVKLLPELRGVRHDAASEALVIGATTTHREIELSPVVRQHLPIISAMERSIANVRVRNQGTIGGNLCFAEPHSDPATLFLALEASVVISNGRDRRVVSLQDFILDAYSTCLEKGEILVEVRIPLFPRGAGAAYKKFGLHERPTVGVAAVVILDGDGSVADARIAVGCVGPKPTRIRHAEELLKGVRQSEFDSRLKQATAAAAAVVDPVDDLHGSAEYKRQLVGVFVRRGVTEALNNSRR